MDLSAIMARHQYEERGYPAYHPKMMVQVLLYTYCIGVPSSHKVGKKLEDGIAFRALATNNAPGFRTISDFRKHHLPVSAGLFLQVLKLYQKVNQGQKGAAGGKHFIQAHNAQVAVRSKHQVIVVAKLTSQPSDKGQAEPLIDRGSETQY